MPRGYTNVGGTLWGKKIFCAILGAYHLCDTSQFSQRGFIKRLIRVVPSLSLDQTSVHGITLEKDNYCLFPISR